MTSFSLSSIPCRARFALVAVFALAVPVLFTLNGCFRAVERPVPIILLPTGPGAVEQDGFRDFRTTIAVDDSLDFSVTARRRSTFEESVTLTVDLHGSSTVEDPAAFGFTTTLPQEDSDEDEATVSLQGQAQMPGTIVLRLSATDGWATTDMRFTITAVGEATQLVFTQQPSDANATDAIEPAITLELRDSEDNLVATDAEVQIALDNNPHGAQLDGTLQVNAVNGVATFNDLSLDRAGAGYTFEASSGSILATSDPFDISPRITQVLPHFLNEDFTVTLFGLGFSDNPADNVVEFDGTPGNVTDASITELTVEVPSSVVAGTVKVTIDGLESNTWPYLLSPLWVDFFNSDIEAHTTSISDDGRFIVFVTDHDIAAGDTNGVEDVYLVDVLLAQVVLISRTPDDEAGNGPSYEAVISGDGRFIAFTSDATDLVPGASPVPVDSQVYVLELASGEVSLVSQTTGGATGNGPSHSPSISHDGSRIAFATQATNLGGGDTLMDIVVRDLNEEETFLVSESTGGTKGNDTSRHPAISPDGDFVVFASQASNLDANKTSTNFHIFLRDITNGTTEVVSLDGDDEAPFSGDAAHPVVSNGGTHIAFETTTALDSADQNNDSDIYVRDVGAGETILVSSNQPGNAAGDEGSFHASITADASHIAFASDATDLVASVSNDARDIYLFDLDSGETVRLSVSASGGEANDDSDMPYLARNGRYCVFHTAATDIVPGSAPGSNAIALGISE